MNIWLIHLGEPLPNELDRRLMRYGMLGKILVDRGHEVTQWAATFDHFSKQQRSDADRTITIGQRHTVQLLYAAGYRRHVGMRRIAFHRQAARAFSRVAKRQAKPDLILTSMPTLEVSAAAADYGRVRGVPVVIDTRDLWPDALYQVFPSFLTPLLRLATIGLQRQLRNLYRSADGFTAVSQSYLDWALQYADRRASGSDRVFPLAYERKQLTNQERTAGEAYWATQGVRRDTAFRACYFGSLGSSTDLQPVLAAAIRNPEIQFVICGSGPKLESWRLKAAALQNVLFPGWVTPDRITVLMELSRVGIAPYAARAMQSLPNKPIEYLSGGLPVLSSLPGEMKQLLRQNDCGLTYSDRPGEQLSDQLKLILDDRLRLQEMSRNALALYQSEFLASSVYLDMAEYLEEMSCQSMRKCA